jgi:hypothetical protein
MRIFILLILFGVVSACSETHLVDYWKNPDIDVYSPQKVLILGLTSNDEARVQFETKLKIALEDRGIQAVRSIDVTALDTDRGKLNEDQLNALEKQLIAEGFDTILFSSVLGVEDKIAYKSNYDGFDETYKRFKEDYLRYQDSFYNPDYYDEYTIYHAETSMYCICPTKERELLWKGYIDITDPREIGKTVNEYVNLVVLALEELNLIEPSGLPIEPVAKNHYN